MPDFVAALARADERAACGAQQVAQGPVELRRHSGRGRFGFAQRGDLQKQLARIDLGMIVGQQIERHGGNLRQQFVERRRVGRGGNVVAMPAPDRGLVVPCGGNRKDHRFRHVRSVGDRAAVSGTTASHAFIISGTCGGGRMNAAKPRGATDLPRDDFVNNLDAATRAAGEKAAKPWLDALKKPPS